MFSDSGLIVAQFARAATSMSPALSPGVARASAPGMAHRQLTGAAFAFCPAPAYQLIVGQLPEIWELVVGLVRIPPASALNRYRFSGSAL